MRSDYCFRNGCRKGKDRRFICTREGRKLKMRVRNNSKRNKNVKDIVAQEERLAQSLSRRNNKISRVMKLWRER